MFESITKAHSDAIDDILKARRTVWAFSEVLPEKKTVEQIIRAGKVSPFAGIPAWDKPDFRRIFVIPTDSDIMKTIEKPLLEKRSSFSTAKNAPDASVKWPNYVTLRI